MLASSGRPFAARAALGGVGAARSRRRSPEARRTARPGHGLRRRAADGRGGERGGVVSRLLLGHDLARIVPAPPGTVGIRAGEGLRAVIIWLQSTARRIRTLRGLTPVLAAAVLLWGCESPKQTLADIDDGSVGDALRSVAITSQNRRNYPAAVNYYQSLYARDPEDLASLLGLARNLRYVGSAAQAIDLLEKGLEKNSGRIDLRAELGKAQLAGRRAADAVVTLTEVTKSAPNDWRAMSALGIAHDMLGNFAEAQAQYDSALSATPNNTSVLNNLALSLTLSGDLDGGIAILERAAKGPRSNAQLRQNLALLYAMKGDTGTAERLLRQDLPDEMVRHNLKYYEQLRPTPAKMPGAPAMQERLPVQQFALSQPWGPFEPEFEADARSDPVVRDTSGAAATVPQSTVAAAAQTATTPRSSPVPPVPAAKSPAKPSAKPPVAKSAKVAKSSAKPPADPAKAAKAPAKLPTVTSAEAAKAPAKPLAVAAVAPKSQEEPRPRPKPAATVAALEVSVAAAASAEADTEASAAKPAATAATAFKVQFGVFPTKRSAIERLAALRKSYLDLLEGLSLEIAELEAGGVVAGYRLLAGPLESAALAAEVCTRFHSRREGCTLVVR